MKLDVVLWWIAAALISVSVYGQYHFASQPLIYRAGGILLVLGLSALLVSRTALAKKFWSLCQDSVIELRKVVWPTRKETMQSTIAVLVMVFVMGLVLWSIDAVLVRVMAWIIRQGAA